MTNTADPYKEKWLEVQTAIINDDDELAYSLLRQLALEYNWIEWLNFVVVGMKVYKAFFTRWTAENTTITVSEAWQRVLLEMKIYQEGM